MPEGHPQPVPANQSILEANLRALSARSPRAAEAIRRATPRTDITFSTAPDGALTAFTGSGETAHRLASAHAPLREAQRLADSIDIVQNAAVAIRGFALGHHVAALARRLGQFGVVVVYEPDTELLHAVLSRTDCTHWLANSTVGLVTNPEDRGELSSVLAGCEGIASIGTKIIDHPASRVRLRPSAETFGATLAEVIASVRTNVATTLVHVETTLRNLLNNVGHYTRCEGIASLKSSRGGVPAIVVSAGPSLRRNIELLNQPGVRDRVVIIAVQTVLKQLLAMGIKPHFVTALDYHEISERFYEGLTAADVEGVTLVIEPKCNPAIPRAFPGVIRCVADDTLDQVLGKGLARPMGSLPAGATVAHLCYSLARFMGCDPVILIGQDLGFTENLYYGSGNKDQTKGNSGGGGAGGGAAIHRVWSGELSDFRTLEMLEWERIARMRGLLRRVSDQQGRPIYTDEQMATYQLLFERAFQQDAARGLTVIDATEGGTQKQHTRTMPLSLALQRCGVGAEAHVATDTDVPAPITTPNSAALPHPRTPAIQSRLALLATSAHTFQGSCAATVTDLNTMLAHFDDQPRVDTLIDQVQKRAAAIKAEPAFWLIAYLNQAGTLNRFRADRAIALQPTLAEDARQRMQIERDIRNVTFMGQAAQQAAMLLEQGLSVLNGAPPQTRDLPPSPPTTETTTDTTPDTTAAAPRARVIGLIHFDTARSALCVPRSRADAATHLTRTLQRLARCSELDGIIIATDDEPTAREAIASCTSSPAPHTPVTARPADMAPIRARRRAVAAARTWSRHCWRGGIAGLTVFDEVLCPAEDAAIAKGAAADALVLLGDDWIALDPALVDAIIARHREAPATHRLTFSQAPPGLGAALIATTLLAELATAPGVYSTLGSLVGYMPARPRMDPIAKAPCIPVDPLVRDCLLRCTGDDINFMRALRQIAPDSYSTAPELICALGAAATHSREPESLEVNAATCGWQGVAPVIARIRAAALRQPALGVTITDPTCEHDWRALADGARAAGARSIHLRTTHEAILACGPDALIDALDLPIDVVSILLPADSQTLWEARTGADTRDKVWDALQEFIDERNKRAVGGLPRTWLVPRIERCDATIDELEQFFDRWLTSCGACVIEPAHESQWWESTTSLAIPTNTQQRRAWSLIQLDTPDADTRHDTSTLASTGAAI